MIKLDLIGLALTVLLLGPRYYLYSLPGAFLLEGVRLATALALGQVPREVLIGGVTGVTYLGASPLWQIWLVNLAGPVFLYFLAWGLGGNLRGWWNPFFPPRRPLPVLFMRLAVISLLLFLIRR